MQYLSNGSPNLIAVIYHGNGLAITQWLQLKWPVAVLWPSLSSWPVMCGEEMKENAIPQCRKERSVYYHDMLTWRLGENIMAKEENACSLAERRRRKLSYRNKASAISAVAEVAGSWCQPEKAAIEKAAA